MKNLLLAALVIVGLYFLVVHYPPLPFNHEELGLGVNHNFHSVVGVVILVVAGFVLWKGRRK